MRRGVGTNRRPQPDADDIWFRFKTNPLTGVDVAYKERHPTYHLDGDRHPFWELLYVDRGAVRIWIDRREFTPSQGEFLLIGPNQWHAATPAIAEAAFYVTVHFETNLRKLDILTNLVLKGDEEARRLLTALLKEKNSRRTGAEALARCYLAEFLIRAIRCKETGVASEGLATYFQTNAKSEMVKRAVDYMRLHLSAPLSLETISKEVGVSGYHLEHLFKKKVGIPVMHYLQELRIVQAKTLLLQSTLNISQIAERTGYSSVHLFSRRFKKLVSIPPSQYAKMIRLAIPSGGVAQGRTNERTLQ